MPVFVWLLFFTTDTKKKTYMFCYQYQLQVLLPSCCSVYCQGFFYHYCDINSWLSENTSLVHNSVYIRGCADKSLTWRTSRWPRTESIVSLERRVCSCAELQVFSCYRGWKEACQATRAISAASRSELSSSFFFSCKARRRRKFTPFWQKH